jgi:hypothetical protein
MNKFQMAVGAVAVVLGIVLINNSDAADYELTWEAPNKRIDGRPLAKTEIGGYTIRYRKLSERAFVTVQIPDREATSYTITGLADVPYRITIGAYDNQKSYSTFIPFIFHRILPGSPINPCGVQF